jgi:hypothetical protein
LQNSIHPPAHGQNLMSLFQRLSMQFRSVSE